MSKTKKVATDAQADAIINPLLPYIKRAYREIEIQRDIEKIDVDSTWEKLKSELHKLDQKGG